MDPDATLELMLTGTMNRIGTKPQNTPKPFWLGYAVVVSRPS